MFNDRYFKFRLSTCETPKTMGYRHMQKKVAVYALSSRLFLLVIGAFFNYLIEDHQPTDTFIAPGLNATSNRSLEHFIYTAFGGLARWDAQHYFHIATYGYTYENNLAFFPLFPYTLGTVSNTIHKLLPDVEYSAVLLATGVIINLIFFVLSSEILFQLSIEIFGDAIFAYKSTVFFCLSPASVFFIAPYTETMFTFFTFSGMLCCIKSNFIRAAACFSISALVRSNGLMNIGFILYFIMYKGFKQYSIDQNFTYRLCFFIIKFGFIIIFSIILILSPYIMFQIFGHVKFCFTNYATQYPKIIINHALSNKLVMPLTKADWCNDPIPLPYFKVQKKYWNVGFLQYYHYKQIPNFVLSSPIIILVFSFGIKYIKQNLHHFEMDKRKKKGPLRDTLVFLSILPFFVHTMLLTLYCILFINVQVTTRLIASSSPYMYWVASTNFILRYDNYKKYLYEGSYSWQIFPFLGDSVRKSGNWIRLYFLLYIFIGLILFTNNYPWT